MKAKLIKTNGNHYDLYVESIGLYTSTYQWTRNGNLLSIENCQAIERGYDLDELAENIKTEDGFAHRQSFIVGFQKALELIGDKAFNEKDGKFIFDCGRNYQVTGDIDCHFKNAIQSLQQTEWDVDVKMRSKDIDELRESGEGFLNNKNLYVPELDADGCLILKLKSE